MNSPELSAAETAKFTLPRQRFNEEVSYILDGETVIEEQQRLARESYASLPPKHYTRNFFPHTPEVAEGQNGIVRRIGQTARLLVEYMPEVGLLTIIAGYELIDRIRGRRGRLSP